MRYRFRHCDYSIEMLGPEGNRIGYFRYEPRGENCGYPAALIRDFEFSGNDGEAGVFRGEIIRRLAPRFIKIVSLVYSDTTGWIYEREKEYDATIKVLSRDRQHWPSFKVDDFMFCLPIG